MPDDADLPHRGHDILKTNYWWIELGGEQDSIHDTEELRDELLKIAFGVWDHIKNHGDHGADNWALDWVGFLPGKRESRRYVGDHVLTQNDVRAEGRFDDLVAYGGWTMDDHHPGGMHWPGKPTIFHPAPSPFGIPYRCLYSRNVAQPVLRRAQHQHHARRAELDARDGHLRHAGPGRGHGGGHRRPRGPDPARRVRGNGSPNSSRR